MAAQPVLAQDKPIDELLEDTRPQSEPGQVPEVDPDADLPPVPDIAPLIDPEVPVPNPTDPLAEPPVDIEIIPAPETETPMPAKPDYSDLTEAQERQTRLDKLFERLKDEENAEDANLIAESIWAIWLDSTSDSVNLLLRRGTAAEKRGDDKLARILYDHVTRLSPDYAEGWSRSARLAIEEGDLSRALSEVTRALVIEPRHFYAFWTLGNIFERIGNTDAAYEAYSQANALYPELKAVKDRVGMLRKSIEGDAL